MSETLFRTAKLAVDGRIVGVSMAYGADVEVSDGGRSYRERFTEGVFARSIVERRTKIRLLSVDDTRTASVGADLLDLQETSGELFAAFAVPESREGDAVLAAIEDGAAGVIGFRPVQHRTEGDVVVRTEAALFDVRIVTVPQHVIPRSVAHRRLQLLELEMRGAW